MCSLAVLLKYRIYLAHQSEQQSIRPLKGHANHPDCHRHPHCQAGNMKLEGQRRGPQVPTCQQPTSQAGGSCTARDRATVTVTNKQRVLGRSEGGFESV